MSPIKQWKNTTVSVQNFLTLFHKTYLSSVSRWLNSSKRPAEEEETYVWTKSDKLRKLSNRTRTTGIHAVYETIRSIRSITSWDVLLTGATYRGRHLMFSFLFTARKRSLRRLSFYTCLSVHRGSTWAGKPLGRYPPKKYTPGRYTARQVHSPGRYTTSPGQVHSPLGRYTPVSQAGTPPPPGRYTPPSTVCYDIRTTSGWYASYWNAFLLH